MKIYHSRVKKVAKGIISKVLFTNQWFLSVKGIFLVICQPWDCGEEFHSQQGRSPRQRSRSSPMALARRENPKRTERIPPLPSAVKAGE
jgi:hypothetical protein